jgi:hypothetical protein
MTFFIVIVVIFISIIICSIDIYISRAVGTKFQVNPEKEITTGCNYSAALGLK